jgi:hypothetical protein
MKITWDDFVKEVKKKYPKAKPEKVLNMVQTIYGKKYQESNYNVIRGSWTMNAVSMIYDKLEKHKTRTKSSLSQVLAAIVNSEDYINFYNFIQGNLGKNYSELSKEKHIRNLRDTWGSAQGKKFRKVLEENGGKYPFIATWFTER